MTHLEGDVENLSNSLDQRLLSELEESHRPSPQKEIYMQKVGISFQGTVDFPEACLFSHRTEQKSKDRKQA